MILAMFSCSSNGDNGEAVTHTMENGVCTECGGVESSDGLLFSENSDGTYTLMGIGSCTDKDIVVDIYNNKSVTALRDYAFSDNYYNIESITLGNNVTTIGDYAFYKCSALKNINIPNSVTSVGPSAFQGCKNLVSITIPDSVTFIGDRVFSECSSLESIAIGNGYKNIAEGIFINCTSLTSITIPEGASEIGAHAFSGCSNLRSITIPSSVTAIFQDLNNCTNLTDIYYTGTAEEWEKIKYDYNNLTNATIHYNYTE